MNVEEHERTRFGVRFVVNQYKLPIEIKIKTIYNVLYNAYKCRFLKVCIIINLAFFYTTMRSSARISLTGVRLEKGYYS